MAQFRVHDGMTIFDLAIQLYGDITMVRKLLKDNNISLMDDITGLTLVYDDTNAALTNHFKLNGLVVNTGNTGFTVNDSAFDSSFDGNEFH